MYDYYARGLPIESSILPLLKHACGEETSCHKVLALKPRGDITRSPKQGYQWPHKEQIDFVAIEPIACVRKEIDVVAGAVVPCE